MGVSCPNRGCVPAGDGWGGKKRDGEGEEGRREIGGENRRGEGGRGLLGAPGVGNCCRVPVAVGR